MSAHSPETSTTTDRPADGAGRFDRGTAPVAAETSGATSGRATTAFVLGILAIPAALLPILGLVIGVVGLVLGLTARSDIRRRGLTNMHHAKWGVILCSIGLVLTVANAVAGAIIAGG
jgi:thiol:disulfide interchange protein